MNTATERSPFDLTGRTALVTGAKRGLGLAIAHGLAAAGAHVGVHARKAEEAEAAAALLTAKGLSSEPVPFDLQDHAAGEAALAALAGRSGRLDILVNNAGGRDRRVMKDIDPAAFHALLEVNLTAVYALCRAAARDALADGGAILNITSIAGQVSRGDVSYAASKGGLDALTRALAAELGGRGIRVNAIAPGFFATEANEDMAGNKAVAGWLEKRTSLRRWGRAEEIAGAAVFLVSDAASYVTGHTLAVDGGYLAHF